MKPPSKFPPVSVISAALSTSIAFLSYSLGRYSVIRTPASQDSVLISFGSILVLAYGLFAHEFTRSRIEGATTDIRELAGYHLIQKRWRLRAAFDTFTIRTLLVWIVATLLAVLAPWRLVKICVEKGLKGLIAEWDEWKLGVWEQYELRISRAAVRWIIQAAGRPLARQLIEEAKMRAVNSASLSHWRLTMMLEYLGQIERNSSKAPFE